MSTTTIVQSILLPPRCLDENIFDHTKLKLIELIGKCTPDSGYIIKILRFCIIDTEVSRASTDIIIRVRMDTLTLKPEIGQVYKCIVSSCIPTHGIYAHHKGKLKVLVTERSMGDCTFSQDTCKVGDKSIKVGDEIDVMIKAIKYDRNNFQSVGVLTM